MAIGVGIITWICLPRFPDKLKDHKHWLFTPEEIEIACKRAACKTIFMTYISRLTFLTAYNTIGAKVIPLQIWVALKDPKTWAFILIQAGIGAGVGTVGVFLPSFIKAFGYSTCKGSHPRTLALQTNQLTSENATLLGHPLCMCIRDAPRCMRNIRPA